MQQRHDKRFMRLIKEKWLDVQIPKELQQMQKDFGSVGLFHILLLMRYNAFDKESQLGRLGPDFEYYMNLNGQIN